MKTVLKILTCVAFSVLLAACPGSGNQNANSQNNAANSASSTNKANQTRDDVEEFETLVKLPFHPEEAVWHEEPLGKQDGDKRVPAPNEKKLIAVIKFKMDEAEQVAAQAAKHKPGTAAKVNTESWFPDELTALSQISGDKTLKGTVYQANDFFQAPYTDGKITRIENSNYFVLELLAK